MNSFEFSCMHVKRCSMQVATCCMLIVRCHTVPCINHTAPDCNHTAPDCNHTALDCNHTAPDCNHTAPDCNHTALDCNHTALDCNHIALYCNHIAPDFNHAVLQGGPCKSSHLEHGGKGSLEGVLPLCWGRNVLGPAISWHFSAIWLYGKWWLAVQVRFLFDSQRGPARPLGAPE